MAYTVKFHEEPGYIQVNVEGELNLQTLKGMATDVAKLAQEQKCFSILNDLRNANPAKGALDIFSMPKTAKKAGVDITFRRALVVGNKADDFRFLETVFVNQGHQVMMFPDIAQALVWL